MLRLFVFVFLLGCIGFTLRAATLSADLAQEIILTLHAGGRREDGEIRRWQERARGADATAEVFERLGWAWVAKGRRSLDDGCYKLAELTAEAMTARFGPSAAAHLLRGHALHQMHRFAEAEKAARLGVAQRGAAEDFGLLSDALMEQGRLTDAAVALQEMMNAKPGAEAFSRVAQLRWLKGDPAGAMAAMQSAHRATDPRDSEKNAWMLTRLALLYLQSGEVDQALACAEAATKAASDYPPALLALGRATFAAGRREEALTALRQAAQLNRLPEYQWWLSDALHSTGRVEDAAAIDTELKRRGEAADPRTLALFLATRGESAALALRLARAEMENRADIFTRDALAWALAASGDFEAAAREMHVALAEGTKDARLFFHAGEIAAARGRPEEAAEFFARARPGAASLTPSERARLEARGSNADPSRGSGGATTNAAPAPAPAIILLR